MVAISENMLSVAREKYQTYPNVEFHQASVHSLPFASQSFDVVVSAKFEINRATKVRFGVIWGLMAVTAVPSEIS
ncbi:class I SAM-dependent methyltransferase [Stanieria cyanosphaera]|jgi:ubiquinone/menaquinone biosynthesis C-methylase UbiE|uniref:class I SAM-dependent methyltransferase n=1 Tax=Stanieria cyanosphaera TaxID=102116 RepID=UPI00059F9696|nr:class I SAM-dependent methyltransferase [Stanieria cyanosphaera]